MPSRGAKLMAARVVAVIPARLGSSRFPDKVIFPINDKPMIYHVHRSLNKAKLVDRVVVATDDQKIKSVVEEFGGEVVMTSRRHKTGSDRAAEVLQKIGGEIIINVQGDNLSLKPALIDRLINCLITDRKVNYATLAYRITDDEQLFDPNKVKVIIDADDNALWFSRYPLPYLQKALEKNRHHQFPFYGHIGVYAYRSSGLKKYTDWKQSRYELAESLEQLRILENGYKIKVLKTTARPISIDRPEDLKKINNIDRI